MLQRAAIGKVSGDAGRVENVIADRRVNASNSAPADDAPPSPISPNL
jgi:hypothetical protein